MPGINGIDTTRKSLAINNNLKIIALTMYGDEDYYLKMINAGAAGFLLKDAEISEVKKAIMKVLEGETYFPGNILYQIVKGETSGGDVLINNELSEREIEILELICKGLSNQEIAESLFISKRTVDKHRANLLGKTNSKNTASLILFAIRNKLIEI